MNILLSLIYFMNTETIGIIKSNFCLFNLSVEASRPLVGIFLNKRDKAGYSNN